MVIIPENISAPSDNGSSGSTTTPAYTSTPNPLEEADRHRPMGAPPLRDIFGRKASDNAWWRAHPTMQFGANWLEVIASWFQMQKSNLFGLIDPNHKFLTWTNEPEWRYEIRMAVLTGNGPYGKTEFNPIDRDPALGTHQILRLKDDEPGASLTTTFNKPPGTTGPETTTDREPLPSTPISFSRLDLGMVR